MEANFLMHSLRSLVCNIIKDFSQLWFPDVFQDVLQLMPVTYTLAIMATFRYCITDRPRHVTEVNAATQNVCTGDFNS